MKDIKILFLTQADSYLFCFSQLSQALKRAGKNTEIAITRDTCISDRQIRDAELEQPCLILTKEQIFNLKYLEPFTHVFIGIGGSKLQESCNRIKEVFSSQKTRPKIITIFPGISFYRKELGYKPRSKADTIVFNTDKDKKEYTRIEKKANWPKVKKITLGHSILLRYINTKISATSNNKPINTLSFIHQSIIPHSHKRVNQVIRELIRHASTHPKRTIYIKLRQTNTEQSNHKSKINFITLFKAQHRKHKNVNNISIFNGTMKEIIQISDAIISISSTGILEAITQNKKTAAISDYKNTEAYGSSFFTGSNILKTFEEIHNDAFTPVCPAWKKNHALIPNETDLLSIL